MAAVAPALLVLDVHDIGTVGRRQLHPHSVLHQLRAGLQIEGRIVRRPHGVLLIVDQTQRTEDGESPDSSWGESTRGSLDDISMIYFGLKASLYQIIADLLGHHYRAVLPSRASECYR